MLIRTLGEVDALFLPLLFASSLSAKSGSNRHVFVLFKDKHSHNHLFDPEIPGQRKDRAHWAGKTVEKKERKALRTRHAPKVRLCSQKNQVEAMKTSSAEQTSPVKILSARCTTHVYPATGTTCIHHVIVGLTQACPPIISVNYVTMLSRFALPLFHAQPLQKGNIHRCLTGNFHWSAKIFSEKIANRWIIEFW